MSTPAKGESAKDESDATDSFDIQKSTRTIDQT